MNLLWRAWLGLPLPARQFVVPGYFIFWVAYGWAIFRLLMPWYWTAFLLVMGFIVSMFVSGGLVGWLIIREFAAYRSKMGRYGEK